MIINLSSLKKKNKKIVIKQIISLKFSNMMILKNQLKNEK